MNVKKPIFAHPERVGPLIGDVDKISHLVNLGVLIQVNSCSILKMFGEKVYDFAWELIDKGLVHFIASDAHSSRLKPLSILAASPSTSGSEPPSEESAGVPHAIASRGGKPNPS